MYPLTPTQRAICAVIRENGGWATYATRFALAWLAKDLALHSMCGRFVTVDGHKVTKKEYEEYEREESKKATPPRP
jgi:hypothetical protein